MGSPVTITPDPSPQGVTITPDAAPQWQPGPVSRFLSNLWEQVNPISGIKGAAQATAHPIDTLMNDASARKAIYDKAEESFKKGDYVGGSAHLLYSMTPLLGPSLDKAGEQFASGDIAGGAGASTGIGLNLAGPEVAGKVASAAGAATKRALLLGKTPEAAYESALKPSTVIPEAQRAAMTQTAFREGIPVSKGGLEKVGTLIDDLNTKISDTIAQDPNRPINPSQAVKNLSGTRQKFATQVNPTADLSAIDASGQEFLDQFRSKPGGAVRNMTAAEAQAMKQGTYRVLGDKSYGELQTASVEAQKALARGLKEEIANAFPEIDALNAREGSLLDLQPSLERAVNRISNHQIMGIGTPIAVGATKALTGSSKLAAAAGVMKAVLDDPYVKSQLAISLSRGGKMSAAAAMARIAGYSNALGAASSASGRTASDQAGQ